MPNAASGQENRADRAAMIMSQVRASSTLRHAAPLNSREGWDREAAELVEGLCEHLDFGPQLGRRQAGPLSNIAAQAAVQAAGTDKQGPRTARGDLADSCAQFAAHFEADTVAARTNETEDRQGTVVDKVREGHAVPR
jgi:hypothetical protein